jgi:hypothetical protein
MTRTPPSGKSVSFRVPDELFKQADEIAEALGLTRSAFYVLLTERGVANRADLIAGALAQITTEAEARSARLKALLP